MFTFSHSYHANVATCGDPLIYNQTIIDQFLAVWVLSFPLPIDSTMTILANKDSKRHGLARSLFWPT